MRLFSLFALITTLALLGSLYISGAYFFSAPTSNYSLLIPVIILSSFFFPATSISLCLLLLPLGGNRPGSAHAALSIIVGCSLYIGLAAHIFRNHFVVRSVATGSTVIYAILLYATISLLSLISLPWPYTLEALHNSSLHDLLQVSEHSLLYPIQSAFLTILAVALGIQIATFCKHCPTHRHTFAVAILLGLVNSIFIGLADYYEVISLAGFRDLDPIVNPGGIQFRLQSFFAHSGWFAEYITLTIPFTLALLCKRWSFWFRVVLILCIMLLGEFTLILTYQRGGWLSYPLTLLVIWTALYVTRRIEKGEYSFIKAVKSSALKIIISLPLTIALSLLLVTQLKKEYNNTEVMHSYFDRFKAIGHTSDRTDFFYAGVLIGLQHPILGAGCESFASEFERLFEDPAGKYYKKFTLPLHGSAHNVYAQTFAGKGFLGLGALLWCCISTLLALGYLREKHALPLEQQVYILLGASFTAAFLIYGNVQEIFYIQSLQYLFFIALGITASAIPEHSIRLKNNTACILLVAIGLHIAWEFIWPAGSITRWQTPPRIPCFAAEPHPIHNSFRWCGPASFIEYQPDDAERIAKHITLTLQSTASTAARPITVQIHVPDTKDVHVTVSLEPVTVNIPIPTLNAGESIPVLFNTQQWFIPAQVLPDSRDQRKLSFQLLG